jgi:hypothetical protein
MKTSDHLKAGWLALTLVVLFLFCWEFYWRSQGFKISINDDESLWTSTRKGIYQASTGRPVIIGSSRAKFDIDLPTWTKSSGFEPVQLALVGTSPRPVLTNLGNDPKFNGTVLVDVTEGLFFTNDGSPMEGEAKKRLEYYPKWSYSQQISFYLNNFLESFLVFLDINRFTLSSLLKRLPIPSRPGVFVFPNFPLAMSETRYNRQEVFSDGFLADTSVQHGVQYVWSYLGMTNPNLPAVSGDTLTHIFADVKHSVDKIKARGGKVLFLRMPSSDPVLTTEQKVFPRKLYWDRLLQETGSTGIHFEDYPELAKYNCPDWSHLTPADAQTFTADLIKIIEIKTGWKVQKTI